jgi:hypothetical protein
MTHVKEVDLVADLVAEYEEAGGIRGVPDVAIPRAR